MYRTCEHCGASLDPGELCDCCTETTEDTEIDVAPEASLRCVTPAVVDKNLYSLASYIQSALAIVAKLPETKESNIRVKAIRADLRRQFDSLEDQRKQVKAAVMAPYLAAEKEYREKIADPFKEADSALKSWSDTYQSRIKAACRKELEDYFNELCSALHIDFLSFDQAGVVVDMATATLKDPKKARNAIHDFLNRVSDDLTAICSMENASEVLAEYKLTLSVASAIAAVNDRHKRQVKADADVVAKKDRDRQQKESVSALHVEAPEILPANEDIYEAVFSVTGTLAQLRALKAFLDGSGYTYQEVTDNE